MGRHCEPIQRSRVLHPWLSSRPNRLQPPAQTLPVKCPQCASVQWESGNKSHDRAAQLGVQSFQLGVDWLGEEVCHSCRPRSGRGVGPPRASGKRLKVLRSSICTSRSEVTTMHTACPESIPRCHGTPSLGYSTSTCGSSRFDAIVTDEPQTRQGWPRQFRDLLCDSKRWVPLQAPLRMPEQTVRGPAVLQIDSTLAKALTRRARYRTPTARRCGKPARSEQNRCQQRVPSQELAQLQHLAQLDFTRSAVEV